MGANIPIDTNKKAACPISIYSQIGMDSQIGMYITDK